jgi:Outer membrane protein LpxR
MRQWVAELLLSLVLGTAHAASTDTMQPVDAGTWRQGHGVQLQIDNDFFAPSNNDRDYTGGLSISAAQFEAARWWNPERWLGGLAAATRDHGQVRALQFQLVAFTPGNLSASEPQPQDRPYASLWALSGVRQRISPNGDRVLFASLTTGLLGLKATESVHRAVHRAVGTEIPAGYPHQISHGGEPTIKVTIADRRLLAGGGVGLGGDVWVTTTGSAGYLTEAGVAIAARWGDRGTPWWAAAPELAEFAPAPDFAIEPRGSERTIDAGLRLSARVWNAFLQGQFRHSDVRFGWFDTNPLVATAWIGVTVATASGSQFSYRLTAQSPELRSGPASRVEVWGSLTWQRHF